MKHLGSKALHKIEELITTASPRKNKSPNRLKLEPNKSTAPFSPSPSPTPSPYSPSPIRPEVSPRHKKKVGVFVPMEREIKVLERHTHMLYQELDRQKTYRLQNPHSIFLNERNPKPPIYQRAQDIVREREAMLEEMRLERLKQKEEEQNRQYQQYLREQPPKKVISKETAQQITDKLYKDHYSKTNRLNSQKLERFREEAKSYRNKPLISTNTKEIYQKVAVKNQLDNDIINRFEKYEAEKKEVTREREKSYKHLYYPFQPTISDNSRIINSARKERPDKSPVNPSLNKTLHCYSCSQTKQGLNSGRSPRKATEPLTTSKLQFQ